MQKSKRCSEWGTMDTWQFYQSVGTLASALTNTWWRAVYHVGRLWPGKHTPRHCWAYHSQALNQDWSPSFEKWYLLCFNYVSVRACLWIHVQECRCQRRPEEDTGFLEAGVMGDCEPSAGAVWILNCWARVQHRRNMWWSLTLPTHLSACQTLCSKLYYKY